MIPKIEKLIICCVFAAILSCSGCGIIGIAGTPSQYEKEVPAEYDLAKQKGKKLLILVEQPGWLSAKVNLRYYLTEAVRGYLVADVKVPPKSILSYDELSKFRSSKSDFSLLSPQAVGKALGADIVLLIKIVDCQVGEVAGSGAG